MKTKEVQKKEGEKESIIKRIEEQIEKTLTLLQKGRGSSVINIIASKKLASKKTEEKELYANLNQVAIEDAVTLAALLDIAAKTGNPEVLQRWGRA